MSGSPSAAGDAMATATHDYTRRYLGHDFLIHRVENEGWLIHVSGWGEGLREGDYLILPNTEGSTRYRLVSVSYYADPPDMWTGSATFSPRAALSQVESE